MIYSTEDNRLFSSNFALEMGKVDFLTIKIDCESGYTFSLSEGADADLAVEAKQEGAMEYTNIGIMPIDLSQWDGTRQTFVVRLTTQEVVLTERKKISFRVGRAE